MVLLGFVCLLHKSLVVDAVNPFNNNALETNFSVNSGGHTYARSMNIGTTQFSDVSSGTFLNVAGPVAIGSSYTTFPASGNGLIVEGNVGIGTTCPGYKLDVNGTIRSKEWIVENFTACDFVFEPDYKRMDYKEKEKFFKENRHLQRIASAKESDVNGMKAGETISGIIMNVEENSLDIIDLYKENKEVKKENTEIKQELKEIKKRNETIKRRV